MKTPAFFTLSAIILCLFWNPLQGQTNEEKVLALIAAFESGDQAALDYISDETYINHNLSVPSTKAVLEGFITGTPSGVTTTTPRSFSVGDIVITHTVYGGVWNGGTPQVGFDVFRFEDGLIVEHWDNLGDVVDDIDGTSQTDGAVTPVSDTAATDANQMLLEEMAQTLFVDGDWTNVRTYFDLDNYIQHSVGAGPDGAFLATLEGQTGLTFYTDVKFVYTLGNFGLVMSEGPDITGVDSVGTYAYYDLFRMEAGKIIEHWDVIQLIPPQDQWANTNGKWGDDAITSIKNELAKTVSIQNHPNPFQDITQFEITTQAPDKFNFKMYDLTGREVYREKVQLVAGKNTFTFNGSSYNNGIYFYVLSNPTGFVQGKMVLSKP